jgi:hypothetical protein
MAGAEPATAKRLPRRDYILLPLTALLTVAVLGFLVEVGARIAWPEQQRDTCEVRQDGRLRMLPNCRSRVKVAEGEWIENRYNECGYRSAASCLTKPPNGLRVALLGTSVARGYWVPYESGFSGRLERTLSSQCERPVEFQNLTFSAADGPVWHTLSDHVDEALRLKPDALVVVVTYFDLSQYTTFPGEAAKAPAPAGSTDLATWIGDLRHKFLSDSRATTIAMHLIFSDLPRYLSFYLRHGDSADYLRPPFTPAWRLRIAVVDSTVDRLANAAHAAGVPLFVLWSPGLPNVLLAHSQQQYPEIDTRAFGNAIADIARRHGAFFVDPMELEASAPDPDKLFYLVDGHPTPEGHQFIAEALGRALTTQVPQFRACTQGGTSAADITSSETSGTRVAAQRTP